MSRAIQIALCPLGRGLGEGENVSDFRPFRLLAPSPGGFASTLSPGGRGVERREAAQ
jgi:hypothetical protein